MGRVVDRSRSLAAAISDGSWERLVGWLPPSLAIVSTLLLLGGGALMVVESRLSAAQIAEEIDHAVRQLKG
jgi:hypothetical protein